MSEEDEFELPIPEPQELPLPYFVNGDVLGIVGQNKRLRYTWMFFVGAPVAALMSKARFGHVSLLPTVATAVACLGAFALSWFSLGAGYSPARSAPILFNRKKQQVFLGSYDEEAGKMFYQVLPISAVRFEDAFGGFGSATLNIKITPENGEDWSILKYSRLIDRKESGSLSLLVDYFMRGHDVIKPSGKAAAEYAAELRKRPDLPPEAHEFVK